MWLNGPISGVVNASLVSKGLGIKASGGVGTRLLSELSGRAVVCVTSNYVHVFVFLELRGRFCDVRVAPGVTTMLHVDNPRLICSFLYSGYRVSFRGGKAATGWR